MSHRVRFPVIYGPCGDPREAAVESPLGHASTERGALGVAGRKLVGPATFERRVAKLNTYPDLEGDGDGNFEPDIIAWSISHQLRGKRG